MAGRIRAAALVSLGVIMILSGCARSANPAHSAGARASRSPNLGSGRWILPLGKHQILVQPGMPRKFYDKSRIYVLDLDTSTSVYANNHRPVEMVEDVATFPQYGMAAVSDRAPYGYEQSGVLWLYRSADNTFKPACVRKGSFFRHVLWSPKGTRIAASLVTFAAMWKQTDWYVSYLQKRKDLGPCPPLHPVPCLVDMPSGAISILRTQGYPLCWNPEGTRVYLDTGDVSAYDLAAKHLQRINTRRDVWFASYSTALNSYVLLSGQYGVELADAAFKATRRVCTVSPFNDMPVPSPDGSLLAYRRREYYYVLDVAAGKETQLGNWTGDMTPAWLDSNTIVVGNTFGNFRTVGLDGKAKREYKIADLAHSDKFPD